MDREISKAEQRKEQRKQLIKIGAGVGTGIALIVVVISFLQTSLNRKDLSISTVDKGVIEVSVSASGKVIPAFEEIINSPINSRIVEIYKKGGRLRRYRHAHPQTRPAKRGDRLQETPRRRTNETPGTRKATRHQPQQTLRNGDETESLPYGTRP